MVIWSDTVHIVNISRPFEGIYICLFFDTKHTTYPVDVCKDHSRYRETRRPLLSKVPLSAVFTVTITVTTILLNHKNWKNRSPLTPFYKPLIAEWKLPCHRVVSPLPLVATEMLQHGINHIAIKTLQGNCITSRRCHIVWRLSFSWSHRRRVRCRRSQFLHGTQWRRRHASNNILR